MDKETVHQKIGKFHAHLDVCEQCERHPFDLCPIGAMLLKDAATTSPPYNPNLARLRPQSWVVGQFQSANFTISSIVQMWSLTPAAIPGVLG